GSDYKVTASMGHLRDLPKSTMGVDIDNGFIPEYVPVKGREDTINELRKAAKASGKVYLATDPDREGEAISWHLKELLGLGDDALRVTFNEITKKVVQDSINNPREIDQNLVDAQQARRILDRIVGYQLSPLLWRKIRRGLSAGRVQSVATRIVDDREKEINAFVPEEYWILEALLSTIDGGTFKAKYYGFNGKKAEIHTEDEANAIIEAVQSAPFYIGSVKRSDKLRNPPPPFITSTLQQEASRRLNMTPRKTMSIAQRLYEGVDIKGEGTVGLITYMRTDSLRISEDALSAARTYIKDNYGDAYYPGTPRRFKVKSGAQDAHEAIRPANIFLTPDGIKSSLTAEQYKLYKLIWSRYIASQMSAAVFDSVTIDAVSAGHSFRASDMVIKFAGYTALYEDTKDEEKEEKQSGLPPVTVGQQVTIKKAEKEQKFTQPPPRYTEATLIKEMEDTGIGRPSTYAPTISTILDREYVVKEGKYLKPTPLGEVVTKLMEDRFTDIVDLNFTAKMESELDSVEKGTKDWKGVLTEFYGPFKVSLDNAEKALEGERIKVPDEVSDEVCDICGRRMVIKSGRFGRFLACPGYPECSFTKPLVVEMPGKCPRCGGRILKRTSKKGYTYYACEKGASCGFMTWDVPVADNCPECGHTMFKRAGKGRQKPFCINEECPNFLPEDKRGYKRKKTGGTDEVKEPAGDEKKTAAKSVKKETKAKTAGKGRKSAG
ncbi:MAG: type I DNA topoisomerase, partial [Oscillospiraceae bacterium]|nr:type I DNA topoisomerase [Oscillospiraceae bacterium]